MFSRLGNRFSNAFVVFGSAVQAAAAMRAGRQPQPYDLKNLGITPSDFYRHNSR